MRPKHCNMRPRHFNMQPKYFTKQYAPTHSSSLVGLCPYSPLVERKARRWGRDRSAVCSRASSSPRAERTMGRAQPPRRLIGGLLSQLQGTLLQGPPDPPAAQRVHIANCGGGRWQKLPYFQLALSTLLPPSLCDRRLGEEAIGSPSVNQGWLCQKWKIKSFDKSPIQHLHQPTTTN